MSKTECKAAKELTQAWRLRKWESLDFLTVALDEMGTRISCLEENVTELMTQAGMDEQPIPANIQTPNK
uniref:Uncharacterized protein n=1 Tax=Hippocampus comes TaxID=109280 RepID=A0A3Q3DL20_HIPCM